MRFSSSVLLICLGTVAACKGVEMGGDEGAAGQGGRGVRHPAPDAAAAHDAHGDGAAGADGGPDGATAEVRGTIQSINGDPLDGVSVEVGGTTAQATLPLGGFDATG